MRLFIQNRAAKVKKYLINALLLFNFFVLLFYFADCQ